MGNYWDLGEFVIRAPGDGDAERLFAGLLESPEQTERVYDWVGFPPTLDGVRAWMAQDADAPGEPDRKIYLVEEKTEGAAAGIAPPLAGFIHIWEADRRQGVFRFGVKVFPAFRGRKLATLAMHKVLDFYFNELRYHKCGAWVYDFNAVSQKFHESLGFVQEGRLREEVFSGGAYHDMLCYGLTCDDFNARK